MLRGFLAVSCKDEVVSIGSKEVGHCLLNLEICCKGAPDHSLGFSFLFFW